MNPNQTCLQELSPKTSMRYEHLLCLIELSKRLKSRSGGSLTYLSNFTRSLMLNEPGSTDTPDGMGPDQETRNLTPNTVARPEK